MKAKAKARRAALAHWYFVVVGDFSAQASAWNACRPIAASFLCVRDSDVGEEASPFPSCQIDSPTVSLERAFDME